MTQYSAPDDSYPYHAEDDADYDLSDSESDYDDELDPPPPPPEQEAAGAQDTGSAAVLAAWQAQDQRRKALPTPSKEHGLPAARSLMKQQKLALLRSGALTKHGRLPRPAKPEPIMAKLWRLPAGAQAVAEEHAAPHASPDQQHGPPPPPAAHEPEPVPAASGPYYAAAADAPAARSMWHALDPHTRAAQEDTLRHAAAAERRKAKLEALRAGRHRQPAVEKPRRRWQPPARLDADPASAAQQARTRPSWRTPQPQPHGVQEQLPPAPEDDSESEPEQEQQDANAAYAHGEDFAASAMRSRFMAMDPARQAEREAEEAEQRRRLDRLAARQAQLARWRGAATAAVAQPEAHQTPRSRTPPTHRPQVPTASRAATGHHYGYRPVVQKPVYCPAQAQQQALAAAVAGRPAAAQQSSPQSFRNVRDYYMAQESPAPAAAPAQRRTPTHRPVAAPTHRPMGLQLPAGPPPPMPRAC